MWTFWLKSFGKVCPRRTRPRARLRFEDMCRKGDPVPCAELDVRLPRQRVLLVPGDGGYRPSTAYCADNLPLLRGTHIAFKFELT